MTEQEAGITISVGIYTRQPNQDRLARADRYVERAPHAIDRHERAAFEQEAERIYREEGV